MNGKRVLHKKFSQKNNECDTAAYYEILKKTEWDTAKYYKIYKLISRKKVLPTIVDQEIINLNYADFDERKKYDEIYNGNILKCPLYNLRKIFEDEYEEFNNHLLNITSGRYKKYSKYLTNYVNTHVYKLDLLNMPHFNLDISIQIPRIFYNKGEYFPGRKKIHIHIIFHNENIIFPRVNNRWRVLITLYLGYKKILTSLYNTSINDIVTKENVKLKILEIFEKFEYLQSDTDGLPLFIKLSPISL